MDKIGEPWVIGVSSEPGRTMIIHAAQPRFFVEITRTAEDEWKVGELTWLDPSPPTEDAGRWHQKASYVFFKWAASSDSTDDEGTGLPA